MSFFVGLAGDSLSCGPNGRTVSVLVAAPSLVFRHI